jgi:hypothetical protein
MHLKKKVRGFPMFDHMSISFATREPISVAIPEEKWINNAKGKC